MSLPGYEALVVSLPWYEASVGLPTGIWGTDKSLYLDALVGLLPGYEGLVDLQPGYEARVGLPT